MLAVPRNKSVAFIAILLLTTFGALATASAHPANITAIDKAFQDHYARGNYPAARIDAQELERLVKARFGANHPDYAVALNKLAKDTEAAGLFERALAIQEKALGANHADVGQSLHNLALVYQDQGKYAEAEELYNRALVIREKALGANHADVAQTLHNLATVIGAKASTRRRRDFQARVGDTRESPRCEPPRRGPILPGVAPAVSVQGHLPAVIGS